MNKGGEADPARRLRFTAIDPLPRLFLNISVGILLTLVPTMLPGAPPTNAAPNVVAEGGARTALQAAARSGRYLFLFFHGDPATGLRSFFGRNKSADLNAIFLSAASKATESADAVSVNIGDAAEQDIVQKYDVSRSPMPMVLVVAPNGAITGGFPGNFTEQQILNAITTPAMEKCLKAVQSRKIAFICLQNSGTRSNEAAMKGVRDLAADPRYTNAIEIVKVDPADAGEAKLLAQFRIDPAVKEATTVFLAPPGVPIATYQGATSKEGLIAKLSSSVTGCAGGCGPNGCGPAK